MVVIRKDIFFSVSVLTALQTVFILAKELFCKTLFCRSMVMMGLMVIFTLAIIISHRRKGMGTKLLFSPVNVILSIVYVSFLLLTLFTIRGFASENLLILCYSSVVTPVFEELLFRGVLWKRFERSPHVFLIVTLLFSLWHAGYAVSLYLFNGGSLLMCLTMKVVMGALFGIVTGFLRLKTGNCFQGFIVHGILNSLSM